MTNTTAIIGQASAEVQKYALTSRTNDGVNPVGDNPILENASFVQNDTSSVTFIRTLVEEGEVPVKVFPLKSLFMLLVLEIPLGSTTRSDQLKQSSLTCANPSKLKRRIPTTLEVQVQTVVSRNILDSSASSKRKLR